jgi:hypothetical protein
VCELDHDAAGTPHVREDASTVDDDGIIPITRPIAVPWGAWALLAAAAAAVAIGTVAEGVVGLDWTFTTDNLVRSLPLALPFLVAAGVVVGAGRWPAGERWLVGGAMLLAVSGGLAVASDVAFGLMAMGTADSMETAQSMLPVVGLLNGASAMLAFAALAVGLWRSARPPWNGPRAAAAVSVGLVAWIAAAGPVATTAMTITMDDLGYLPFAGLQTLSYAATGAVAVAALLAAPARTPLPEVLIASGAAVVAIVSGGSWWALATLQGDGSPLAFEVLSVIQPIGTIAFVVLAAGFGSGASSGPLTTTDQ